MWNALNDYKHDIKACNENKYYVYSVLMNPIACVLSEVFYSSTVIEKKTVLVSCLYDILPGNTNMALKGILLQVYAADITYEFIFCVLCFKTKLILFWGILIW